MVTCIVDECDQLVYIKKTQECRLHYNRRWAAERPTYFQDWQREHRKPSQYLCNPPWLNIGPCTYITAHHRVDALRGRAAEHRCLDCGEPAVEWSYRGGSPWEQHGTKPSKNGRTRVAVVWSSHPGWYDPLCRVCHNTRDGRPPGTSRSAARRRVRAGFKE